jgi:MoxR-like ATPase
MNKLGPFVGNVEPHVVEDWPAAPPWRAFDGRGKERDPAQIPEEQAGDTFRAPPEIVELVNAAIHLRRPLLVTGKAGTGKSSLARAIAHELGLGKLLEWPITSRSTLQAGLYHYDAIGRLQETAIAAQRAGAKRHASRVALRATIDSGAEDIGRFIRLGPLGTALLPALRPRVLLIDEIDKSDIDLPNDLLHVFETGKFEIEELARHARDTALVRAADGRDLVTIAQGEVQCRQFPIVVLTSNGEREFPPAFKRRCVRVTMPEPKDAAELEAIVTAHFGRTAEAKQALEVAKPLIEAFLTRRREGDLATDQLLNAVRLRMSGGDVEENSLLGKVLLQPLSGSG